MKLHAATLRTFTALHTWMGLVAGFALFVAFYAGAITVFHHDLPRWQSQQVVPVQSVDDAQRLLDATLAQHPQAKPMLGMLFPSSEFPKALIYWPNAEGVWQMATLDDLEGGPDLPQAGLATLVNELHYTLGLPVAGVYLMGIVSLLYAVAIVSGVIIHLPKLLKDLFALRPGRNLKQFWLDAHNVVGVLSLPLHLMFAVTGAVLCLSLVLMAALNPLIFDGKVQDAVPVAMDTAPVRSASGTPAALGTLADWSARAVAEARRQGLHDFEPVYMKLQHAGDSNATVEISGESSGTLGPTGTVALDAASGKVIATQLPGRRDANHATLTSAYALHFGEYGNALVPWLYFLLGIGGAFLFYSGNLLWIESRRKRRQAQQGRAQINMARATVGVCIGLCVAISAAFVAVQVLERAAPDAVDAGMRWTCFGSWALCALWAALRAPAQAARELLWTAAAVTAAIPLAHGLASGWWMWTSAAAGQWALFWVDGMALAMALGFAALARATTRRARHGEPNSVWAEPQPAAA